MSASPLRPDDVLRRAHAIGSYYGFTPFSVLAAGKRGQGTKAPYPEGISPDLYDPVARDVVPFLKQVRDANLFDVPQQPLFLWHSNAAPGRTSPKVITLQFHAMGVDRAIADAVLIRTVRALIMDLTKVEPVLRLNSMGDKETRGRFAKELTQFFRKHGAALPPDCVACAKRDVLEATELLIADNSNDSIPSPTDHLSEVSRKHFEDLLEYLESTDTPYELASTLLSRGSAWTETCFEITSDARITAWGARYNDLARPFFKSSLPSIGAVIRIQVAAPASISAMKVQAKPRFVFVHIGEEAKRESIRMADLLRHARIPLTQAIGIESLTEQMRFVETINPPYVIIMGRKEALERSVILRERATHTETFIPLDDLVERLRKVA
ncbi:MAG: His/Gly/Thr/Pro-type tRNA ligase C-terminal domain-containing protein [Minisyncoccia bacterium]